MTEKQILQWIKINLALPIQVAIPGTVYTEDWIAAIAGREVPGLIDRYGKLPVHQVWPLLIGDGGHGFSPWQIDNRSFSNWIASGAWKDPYAAALKAVGVLTGKRHFLSTHTSLKGDLLDRANVAAYNCGEGNILKVLSAKLDIDAYTANHNYSAEVWRLRALYKAL